MASEFVYRVFPEAVAEVEKIVPVALVFLGADVHQVIGKYPDACAAATPEHYNRRNETGILSKVERMIFQLETLQFQVIEPEMPAAGIIRADVDILALEIGRAH